MNLLRPTLGPHPRTVINDRGSPHQSFEVLDSGGTIVRRLIELPDAGADVGAMYLRNLLWRLHERVGDGTATAAVLFDAVYNGGYHYLAAGGSAPRLRSHLQQGMRLVLDELRSMARPCRGRAAIAGLALSLCYDRDLAGMLGEIFTIIGADGRLEIRTHQSRELKREYVEGSYWDGGLLSRDMATDPGRGRAEFVRPGVIISDLEIDDPEDAVEIMELGLRGRSAGPPADCSQHLAGSRGSLSVGPKPPESERVRSGNSRWCGFGLSTSRHRHAHRWTTAAAGNPRPVQLPAGG